MQMLLDNWLRPLPDDNGGDDQTSPNEEVPGRRLESTTVLFLPKLRPLIHYSVFLMPVTKKRLLSKYYSAAARPTARLDPER